MSNFLRRSIKSSFIEECSKSIGSSYRLVLEGVISSLDRIPLEEEYMMGFFVSETVSEKAAIETA